MIIVTTNKVEGREIKKVLGLVQASSVRARAIGRDITALFKLMAGGEITEYTKLLAQTREQSLSRLISEAESRGANAVVGVRFVTSTVAQGASEILIYGTAVELG
ncbi:MAG: YbjQ family protein [SAR202 cluster bacterium]|nr:YbjQ family protein [SAR202 cluster bacterium]